MSMATPRYYDDPDFQKWYDFETGQFKEGAPEELIEKVKRKTKNAGWLMNRRCETASFYKRRKPYDQLYPEREEIHR